MTIEPGHKLLYHGTLVRVMCVAEGYAMCRAPRALPFVVSVKELIAEYERESVRRAAEQEAKHGNDDNA